jgi:hypothetical protein
MKVSGFTLKLSVVLAAGALCIWLHLGSLNRCLERHEADLAEVSRELSSRRAGCEAALADAGKFEGHLGAFLAEREKEIGELKERIASTRRRIGNVEKIREECEKLEKELEAVKQLFSQVSGRAEGER